MQERAERLIGESSAFIAMLERASQLAALDKPVLVVGERGTGKELVAARLHYLSDRWGQPWLKLNCAAISDSLLDSELFGHEAGAFSGATRPHRGYFERADGGTLFLDEVATTSLRVQEKILRVVEYGEFSRLGGEKIHKVDVRLVAATNDHLPGLVAQKRFRADLLDRLAFDVITLPPLRSRPEDILLLAEHFALGMTKELMRDYFPGFSHRAARALEEYPWPGNVRELKNVIERSVYRSVEPEVPVDTIVFDPFASPYVATQAEALAPQPEAPAEPVGASPLQNFLHAAKPLKAYMQMQEAELLGAALSHCQFNQRKTARLLGLTYDQLRGLLRKYKL